jgi:hypothetical protein
MSARIKTPLVPLAVLCCVLAIAPALLASVPGSKPGPWDSSNDRDRPTAVTASVDAVILEVREERTLVVRDTDDRHHEILLPENAKIRADNRRDFDGMKKLEFAQLRPGHQVKLTFLTATGEIVRVKVLGIDPVIAAAAA